MSMRLPRSFPGRREGRRVTTSVLRHAVAPPWVGHTFNITIDPGRPHGWELTSEFEVGVRDHSEGLMVIHEWSRK